MGIVARQFGFACSRFGSAGKKERCRQKGYQVFDHGWAHFPLLTLIGCAAFYI